jgi:hypothetical protein
MKNKSDSNQKKIFLAQSWYILLQLPSFYYPIIYFDLKNSYEKRSGEVE